MKRQRPAPSVRYCLMAGCTFKAAGFDGLGNMFCVMHLGCKADTTER